MGFLRWIFGSALALLLAVFAALNTHNVEVFWSPVHPPQVVPLYMVTLGLTALAFLLGGLSVWLNFSGLRRIKRQQRRQIKRLEKELGAAKDNVQNLTPPADFFPALPQPPKKRSFSWPKNL